MDRVMGTGRRACTGLSPEQRCQRRSACRFALFNACRALGPTVIACVAGIRSDGTGTGTGTDTEGNVMQQPAL